MAKEGSLAYINDAGHSSIDIQCVNTARHRAAIEHLEKYRFWKSGRAIRPLWKHQRAAVSHIVAYLCANNTLPSEADVTEAALLKLPTGSGKSGIIAIAARCLLKTHKTLTLTPRTALTEQLLDDIGWRFWKNIGLPAVENKLWTASGTVAGAPVETCSLQFLLPSNVDRILVALEDPAILRVSLVGTLQALDQICRRRDAVLNQTRLGTILSPEEISEGVAADRLYNHLRTFDAVIVDEGHYEPAPSWSRHVRSLNRPTVLLSATPFRNDYKSFRVRGRFAYNMPFCDATKSHIVRKVAFHTLGSGLYVPAAGPAPAGPAPPAALQVPRQRHSQSEDSDTTAPIALSKGAHDAVREFVALLIGDLPTIINNAKTYTNQPRIMLRAASFEALELLQSEIDTRLGELSVLIHDRVKKDDVARRQFRTVRSAGKNCDTARFWLHQSKLLEGIDDPRYVALGIVDGFANSRQLVQQIGRAIRSTDAKRQAAQTAQIFATKELSLEIQERWRRYQQYENMCRDNIQNLVRNEAALPERILEFMPKRQYVDGDFRERFLALDHVHAQDLHLPLRSSVFIQMQGFSLPVAELELEDAILAVDRFLPRRIEGLPPGMIGRTYFSWGNSPYLRDHYLAEWTLGVCIVTEIDHFVFVYDTRGICFDPDSLRIGRADRQQLLKAFPQRADGSSVISRMAGISLDMSDRAIRSQATRTRSFEHTFTDLADSSLAPTSVYGYLNGKGRYLGLSRARVADVADGYVAMADYKTWLEAIAAGLQSTAGSHLVFERFAQVVTVAPADADPVSILLELSTDDFTEFSVEGEPDSATGLGHELPFEDLCAEVNDQGYFQIPMRDQTPIDCLVEYRPTVRRYGLHSPMLDQHFGTKSSPRGSSTMTQHINRAQNFRILIAKPNIVYSQGQFYSTPDFATASGAVPALQDSSSVPFLMNTHSEKGEAFYGQPRWASESIFGAILSICHGSSPTSSDELSTELSQYDLVLLDDGGDEIGDFIAVDNVRRRVALIHAKASKDPHDSAVSALQIVGRQVVASLAFCSTQARVDGLAPGRWLRPVIANTVRLPISRVFKNTRGLDDAAIETCVKNTLGNAAWQKEIWLVAGRIINVTQVRDAAVVGNLSNRARQLLMYISSLRTSCARANTGLRIFGH